MKSLLILALLTSILTPCIATSAAANQEGDAVAVDTRNSGDEFEPTRVLAIVGGEPVFVGDMLFEVNQLIARFMPDAPESIIDRERRGIIVKMLPKYIEQKMMLIDVKRSLPEGVKFDDVVKSASKEFDDKALEDMMKSTGVDSPVMFDAHLRAQGSSLRKMRHAWTVNQVVRYFLQQKIKSDAEVTHQELLQYYRDHAQDYQIQARARWEQVMVRNENFKSADEAMNSIVEMGNRIVYGAALDGVARKSSQGYDASDGGLHDWTSQGSLVLKEIDAAIFSLPVGQLSDVIKSDQGLHIVRVIEREDAGKVDFREAQIEIREKLETEKRVNAYDTHLAKLKREIPYEILDAPPRTAMENSEPGSARLK